MDSVMRKSKILFQVLVLVYFLATSISAIKFPWDDDRHSGEATSSEGIHSKFPFLHSHKNVSKFSHHKNHTKPSGSHPDKHHGGLDVDFYNIFTSFVNKTRETIPEIAHHGNFTLIQLGLLCALGSMAAGVSLVAAEGFAFRKHETEVEQYEYMKHLHAQQSHSSYGPPPPTTYGHSLLSRQDLSQPINRRKRATTDSSDEDSGEIQFHREIVKPYSSNSGGTPHLNPQFNYNVNPQYPVYSLMYNSPLMANTAYQLAQLQQSYPFPENSPNHRRHGVDKIRRKFQELSSDAEFSRGLPHTSEFRKESRKKKKRLRAEFDLPDDVVRRRYRTRNNDFRNL